ncbi:uncharacterized protein [Clytia hemisphaerica]|uniref:uncharacterized protein n=1 Tax=Clytia hemisphaerica TaxID=252671 RepID=UPI0034D3C354
MQPFKEQRRTITDPRGWRRDVKCLLKLFSVFLFISGFVLTIYGNIHKPFHREATNWCKHCIEDLEQERKIMSLAKIIGPIILTLGVILTILTCRYSKWLTEKKEEFKTTKDIQSRLQRIMEGSSSSGNSKPTTTSASNSSIAGKAITVEIDIAPPAQTVTMTKSLKLKKSSSQKTVTLQNKDMKNVISHDQTDEKASMCEDEFPAISLTKNHNYSGSITDENDGNTEQQTCKSDMVTQVHENLGYKASLGGNSEFGNFMQATVIEIPSIEASVNDIDDSSSNRNDMSELCAGSSHNEKNFSQEVSKDNVSAMDSGLDTSERGACVSNDKVELLHNGLSICKVNEESGSESIDNVSCRENLVGKTLSRHNSIVKNGMDEVSFDCQTSSKNLTKNCIGRFEVTVINT